MTKRFSSIRFLVKFYVEQEKNEDDLSMVLQMYGVFTQV